MEERLNKDFLEEELKSYGLSIDRLSRYPFCKELIERLESGTRFEILCKIPTLVQAFNEYEYHYASLADLIYKDNPLLKLKK